MTPLVIFLEEPSARAMLQGLLPRILPETVAVQYIVFEGKSDLEKRLPKRLRAWRAPDAKFLVLRDQDSGDFRVIKEPLHESSQIAFESQRHRDKAQCAVSGSFPDQALQRRSGAFGAKLFSQSEKSRGFARAWTASALATVQ